MPKKNAASPSKAKQMETIVEPLVASVEMLMNAARSGDENLLYQLYLKSFDLTKKDDNGNTALHIAAANGHAYFCRMVIVLTAPVRLWQISNKESLTAEDVASNDKIRDDLHCLTHGGFRVEDVHTKWNDELLEDSLPWEDNSNVLLAIDGGGIRALICLQMLLYLEGELGGPLLERVDWMAGTSCGGCLALLLTTGHSLDYCRRFMLQHRNNVFCGNKAKVPKHDSAGLEKVVKKVFKDGTMNSLSGAKVLVTVADTRKSPPNLVLFRSFSPNVPLPVLQQYDYLDPTKILLWKAVRSTTAAPYFFESFNGLSDGGLVANNPAQALMADFFQFHKLESVFSSAGSSSEDSDDKPPPKKHRVGAMISIGTGINPLEKTNGIDLDFRKLNKKNPIQFARNVMAVVNNAKNMFQLLIKECTSSNGQPVKYAREWCHSMDTPFFRFSPPLKKTVSLDCTDMPTIIDMMWETECYIQGVAKEELQQLSRYLRKKPVLTVDPTQHT